MAFMGVVLFGQTEKGFLYNLKKGLKERGEKGKDEKDEDIHPSLPLLKKAYLEHFPLRGSDKPHRCYYYYRNRRENVWHCQG